MIIPIRCVSCGKPIGHLWEEFNSRVNEKGEEAKKVLDDLGLDRFCCRSILLGHIEMIDLTSQFKKN